MAYYLRYYKNIRHDDGNLYRLEIYRKDRAQLSLEIGPVLQGLTLNIQGEVEDVVAPIVKTSLTMTFVDAPDHELASTKKCGNWQEFYTPDSTEWRVILKANGSAIWGGYITPDSYTEQLVYRGSVTVIARDNIGHLQDFPFDAVGDTAGMILLTDLLSEAWSKIDSPMSLDYYGQTYENEYLECDGVSALNTYLNVAAFKDMSWYDVLEKILYSYGLALRYVGNNIVNISSLKDIPKQGRESIDNILHLKPIFKAFAQRELTPAIKKIEEVVNYDLQEGQRVTVASQAFSSVSQNCPFLSKNAFGEITTVEIPVWPVINTDDLGWGNLYSSTLFFNPKKYTITGDIGGTVADDVNRMLYLATNTDGTHSVWYGIAMILRNFCISMNFGQIIERYGSTIYPAVFTQPAKLRYVITIEVNKSTYFYSDQGWQEEYIDHVVDIADKAVSLDVYAGAYAGQSATMKFFIVDISLDQKWDMSNGNGIYIPIASMRIDKASDQALLSVNRVNTSYNSENNVILSRNPEFGPAYNDPLFPGIIKNGIFIKSGDQYKAAKKWRWDYSGGSYQQMAVYNHLQILCYFHKPNNIISGDIVNADLTELRTIYEWNNCHHLLLSGSLNYLTGQIEGAVLREFELYGNLWDSSSVPDVEEDSTTDIEEGASTGNGSSSNSSSGGSSGDDSSGGSSGGGTTTTIVVDSSMSSTSTNPVQNKVVKHYVDSAITSVEVGLEEVAESLSNLTEWYNIKTVRNASSSASIDTTIYTVIENKPSNILHNPDYRIVLMTFKKKKKQGRAWRIPMFSPRWDANTGGIINAGTASAIAWENTWWPIDTYSAPWFGQTGAGLTTCGLSLDIDVDFNCFRNNKNKKMRLGAVIMKKTGKGKWGWQQVSNIAEIELYYSTKLQRIMVKVIN